MKDVSNVMYKYLWNMSVKTEMFMKYVRKVMFKYLYAILKKEVQYL